MELHEVLQHPPRRHRVHAHGRDLRALQPFLIDPHNLRLAHLQMCSPCSQPSRARYHPVASFDTFHARACGHDFEAAFIARDCNWVGRAQGGCEAGRGGVGALDLVYVGRV